VSDASAGGPNWPSFQGQATQVSTSPSGRVTSYVHPSLGPLGQQSAQDPPADADRDNTITSNNLKEEFLLQFSTVFLLIAGTIILGIGVLVNKQQLPVLVAGISGYVLGKLGKI